jgi:hypothetical protein
MMRACVRLGAIVAVCAGLFLVPAVASAASPWMPFRAADFDLPAGSRCPFPLSGRVLEDRERIRTLATFPDGSPSRQRVKGPLVVRYINTASGASVVRDLTGDAFIDTHGDGSFTFTLRNGHLAVGLGAGDPGSGVPGTQRTWVHGRLRRRRPAERDPGARQHREHLPDPRVSPTSLASDRLAGSALVVRPRLLAVAADLHRAPPRALVA